ncbi:hypothetical protein [Kaistia sp. 32K]|uniref:DUF6932 family protein n=1 Tax=Kaistia sp. 32K TaxID=2795690 RepID=UPI003530261C
MRGCFPEVCNPCFAYDNARGTRRHDSHNRIEGRIWVDGSFLTKKENPDDVDLLLEVDQVFLDRATADQCGFINWFQESNLYEKFRCDNYLLVKGSGPESEYMFAYWLRQFGFSRSNEMKGLATIHIPSAVEL